MSISSLALLRLKQKMIVGQGLLLNEEHIILSCIFTTLFSSF